MWQLRSGYLFCLKIMKLIINTDGLSKGNPGAAAIGAVLKNERQTPQQLSYLIPILIESGFCEYSKKGKAFLINYIEKNR